MSNVRRMNSPQGLADLILKHDPDASMEMIGSVISEWGDIFDEQRFGDREPIKIESTQPIGQVR